MNREFWYGVLAGLVLGYIWLRSTQPRSDDENLHLVPQPRRWAS